MKQSCGFSPAPLAVTAGSSWPDAQLESFRTTAGEAYFVPLGALPVDALILRAHVTGSDWILQIVSSTFESIAETGSCSEGEQLVQPFRVEQAGAAYYLRVVAPRTVVLERVELDAATVDGTY